MSKFKVPCAEEDYGWESREVVLDTAIMLLDEHIKIKHMPVQPTMATSPTMATLPGTLPQAERLKRPSLTFTDLPKHFETESVDNQADGTTYAQYKNNCRHSMNRACHACIEAEYSKVGN